MLLSGFPRVSLAHLPTRLEFLPRLICVDAWEGHQIEWLHSTLRFMGSEARELKPGGETIITRLADVLVIQALRTWIAGAAGAAAPMALEAPPVLLAGIVVDGASVGVPGAEVLVERHIVDAGGFGMRSVKIEAAGTSSSCSAERKAEESSDVGR